MQGKLTKIVATIGPSSESEETIEKLIRAGVDIFRFNFKHNTVEWHAALIRRVNTVSQRIGVPVGTLIDLQGPGLRVQLPEETLKIKAGDLIPFGEKALASKTGFSITHPHIIATLPDGEKILASDGAFTFFLRKKNDEVFLESASHGVLKQRKSMNIPGVHYPLPILIDRDFEGLKLAQREEVDYVALSFVRNGEDIRTVREEMKKYQLRAKVIAKIETKKSIDNLDEIIELSDGIMVARGDLSVEIPMQEVPYYQKLMIKKAITRGIPVITATQMLESMIDEPLPTRAEISDIANSTYDLTDAVMLSAESATGAYPVEAVRMMASTVNFNEKKNTVDSRLRFNYPIFSRTAVMCDAAYGLYLRLREFEKKDLAGILMFSQTGASVRLLSRYRPLLPVYAFVPDHSLRDELLINYGVFPFAQEDIPVNEDVRQEEIVKAVTYLQELKHVKKGDILISLYGDRWAESGGTSTIKLITV